MTDASPEALERYAEDEPTDMVETMGLLLQDANEVEERCQRMVAVYKELIARRDAYDAAGDAASKKLAATYRHRTDALSAELRTLLRKREGLMDSLRALDTHLTALSTTAEA